VGVKRYRIGVKSAFAADIDVDIDNQRMTMTMNEHESALLCSFSSRITLFNRAIGHVRSVQRMKR
jgi:hypothetical protein